MFAFWTSLKCSGCIFINICSRCTKQTAFLGQNIGRIKVSCYFLKFLKIFDI